MTLIIFDIDGTLVYSERRDSRCFAATYEHRYGKAFPTLDWTRFPHVTDTTILITVIEQHFQRRAETQELIDFQKEYTTRLSKKRRLDPDHSREVPGAKRTMDRLLSDKRYIIGVATGGWRRPAHLKLQHVGIPSGSLMLEGADGRHTREDIINALVVKAKGRHAGIGRIVYVGDAVWDVHTTRNLNMAFIGMRWRGDVEVLEQEGATQVLSNYLEYDRFLEAVHRARPPEGVKSLGH
jgi:phosphoglycolate phosphatase-like HAD superfamily hydrolase